MKNTITLHPINFGFDEDAGPMQTYICKPDHLPWLFMREYKFLRAAGTSRKAARWHCHRMLSMLSNPLGWRAEMQQGLTSVSDDELDETGDAKNYCRVHDIFDCWFAHEPTNEEMVQASLGADYSPSSRYGGVL